MHYLIKLYPEVSHSTPIIFAKQFTDKSVEDELILYKKLILAAK